jgi:hypothetical protein
MQLLLIVQWLQQHLLCCITCNMVGMMANMHLITRTLRMTCAHLWNDKDYKPNGLVFSDDDDFLIDINYDLEDE